MFQDAQRCQLFQIWGIGRQLEECECIELEISQRFPKNLNSDQNLNIFHSNSFQDPPKNCLEIECDNEAQKFID